MNERVQFNVHISTCSTRVSPVNHLYWYWQPNHNQQKKKNMKEKHTVPKHNQT